MGFELGLIKTFITSFTALTVWMLLFHFKPQVLMAIYCEILDYLSLYLMQCYLSVLCLSWLPHELWTMKVFKTVISAKWKSTSHSVQFQQVTLGQFFSTGNTPVLQFEHLWPRVCWHEQYCSWTDGKQLSMVLFIFLTNWSIVQCLGLKFAVVLACCLHSYRAIS